MADTFNPASAYTDQRLTNLVVKYPMGRIVHPLVCNMTTVSKPDGRYWKLLSNNTLDTRDRDHKAPGAESSAVEIDWTYDTYHADKIAHHATLPDDTRETADDELGLEAEHAAIARDQVLLNQEIRCAGVLFDSSVTFSGKTAATTARWDASDKSTIRLWLDILKGARAVSHTCGKDADSVLMNNQTWYAVATYLMEYAATGNHVQWGRVAQIITESPQSIPEMLMGYRLYVANATYASAAKEPADVSRSLTGITEIWTDNCLVFHKGRPGVKSLQLSTYFRVSGYPKVRRGRLGGTAEGDWFEYSDWVTKNPKVVASECGYLLTNTIT